MNDPGGFIARCFALSGAWCVMRRAEDMPVDPDAAWLSALAAELQRRGSGAAGGSGAVSSSNSLPTEPTHQQQQRGGCCSSSPGGELPARGLTGLSQAPAPAPGVGLWAVDTACVVPMRLPGRAHERAYTYRSSTQAGRRVRMRAMYQGHDAAAAGSSPGSNPGAVFFLGPSASAARGGGCSGVAAAAAGAPPYRVPRLGWQPLDLCSPSLDMGRLAASIPGADHAVPGVSHMVRIGGAGVCVCLRSTGGRGRAGGADGVNVLRPMAR